MRPPALISFGYDVPEAKTISGDDFLWMVLGGLFSPLRLVANLNHVCLPLLYEGKLAGVHGQTWLSKQSAEKQLRHLRGFDGIYVW